MLLLGTREHVPPRGYCQWSSFMFCLIFVGYLVATDAIATFLTAWHFFYLLVFLVDNDTYYNVLSTRYVTYCSCFTFIELQQSVKRMI